MIDWRPSYDSGVEAEMVHNGLRVSLWAWPSGARYSARVIVERKGYDDPFDEARGADSLDDAKKMAAELLQLYLDGDPDEQAFRARLRAWVAR